MGLGLRRPCVVCQRLTAPGEARCPTHRITRSPSLRKAAQATTPPGSRTPCADCGTPLPPSAIEWDHVVPLWAGGRDERRNLQPLCKLCHLAKTADDLGRYPPR